MCVCMHIPLNMYMQVTEEDLELEENYGFLKCFLPGVLSKMQSIPNLGDHTVAELQCNVHTCRRMSTCGFLYVIIAIYDKAAYCHLACTFMYTFWPVATKRRGGKQQLKAV